MFESERKVLILIAHHNFRDEELMHSRNMLQRAGIQSLICSTSLMMAKGMFGTEVRPNIVLSDAMIHDYDGLILIGGSGASVYWEDVRVHRMIQSFTEANKPIGAIGEAVAITSRAGILHSKEALIHDILKGMLRGNEEAGPQTTNGNLLTVADAKFARSFAERFADMLLTGNGSESLVMV